jgi:transglutaminase-like putative cysteine protease
LKLARRWARLRSLDRAQWRVLLASVVLVPSVQLALRARGFGWTAQRLAAWSDAKRGDAWIPEARAAAEAVAIVAGRRVVGARCLGRSLVLWFLLRRRGVDARIVVGARAAEAGALPAHAWVEVEGVPVNDAEDVRDQHGSFGLRLPPLAGG